MIPMHWLLLVALLTPLAAVAPASAQAPRNAIGQSERNGGNAIGQSERNAVDLKQGMSLAEVQTLLGKPRRTALKDSSGSSSAPSNGSLKWTYVWPSASSLDKVLNVEFVAKQPAEWYVNGWNWSNY